MGVDQLISSPELPIAAAVGLVFIIAFVGTTAAYFSYRIRAQRFPAYLEAQDLEGQVAEKRGRLAELEKQVTDVARLKQESDAAKAEFEYYRSQIDRIREEYAQQETIQKRVEELNAELSTVLDKLGRAETQLQDAENALIQRRSAAAESEKRQELAEKRTSELEQAQSSLDSRIGSLTTLCEEKATELRRLESDLASVRSELNQTRQSLVATEDEIARNRQQISQLEDRKRSIEADIEAGDAERQNIQRHLGELELKRSELADVVAKLEDVQKELKEKREDLLRLRSEEEWLNAQLARKKVELGTLAGTGEQGEGDEDDALSDLLKPPHCLARPVGDGDYEPSLPEPLADANEEAVLHRVREHLDESRFVFHPRVVNAFHTSLKTAMISPLTVLAGISGTGKSQLPRLYAEAMGMHFLKIPVQPRWDGPQDLFGFYNYIERRYKATDLARALVQLDPFNWDHIGEEYKDRMLLVLLDEMNLARVEYYFSEFLSRLEGRPSDSGANDRYAHAPAEIEIDVSRTREGQGKRVYVGQNVLFVGTMNEDESTLALSDKVLDRANMLRFPKPKTLEHKLPAQEAQHVADGYLPKSRWATHWVRTDKDLRPSAFERAMGVIASINTIMENMGRPFGHRMGQAMLHYVANYPANRNQTNDLEPVHAALADQIEMRILPRLRGVVVENHHRQLSDLADIARDLQDDQLARAIETTREQSRDTNGLFVWRGFTRE